MKKTISKLEEIKQKCDNIIEVEFGSLPENTKDELKEISFTRFVNKLLKEC